MSPTGSFLIAIVIALPIAWLVAEFRGSRSLRIALGLLAIGLTAACTWTLSQVLTRFNYNAWYGGATGDLIKTSLQQIEDGHLERVLTVWRGLDQQYQPTYQNRAHYNELIEAATVRMRGKALIEVGSAWDASVFKAESWVGHWEDETGYWIVIDSNGQSFDVLQSGQPRDKVHDVSVSPDFRVLKFHEVDQWLHTLTLKNKYEATYEWFDLQKGTVWETRSVYKLIRASEEQKAMTQQHSSANGILPTGRVTNITSSPVASHR